MRIAIIRLSALGDIVHTVGLMQYIKKEIPDSVIHWFVDLRFKDVLRHNPCIDQVHALPIKETLQKGVLLTLFREWQGLKNLEAYDVIIDVQGLLKSALVGWKLKGEYWGFDKDSIREPGACRFYKQMVNIPYEEHILRRNATLVSQALGISIDAGLPDKQPILGFTSQASEGVQSLLSQEKKNILLVLSASKEPKKYPKEQFYEAVRNLDAHVIPLWYTETERQDAQWLEGQLSSCHVPEKMNLDQIKALIASAQLIIGGDTGLTHMAWGMNTPSITLFGNTPLQRFCLETPINICFSGAQVDHARGFDQSDFSIRNIPAGEIEARARELLG